MYVHCTCMSYCTVMYVLYVLHVCSLYMYELLYSNCNLCTLCTACIPSESDVHLVTMASVLYIHVHQSYTYQYVLYADIIECTTTVKNIATYHELVRPDPTLLRVSLPI